ncbi:MAG: pyridoxamine kinase [Oscillospiraceae bacterium]|jgi:pyridoxine kinase|nr:pyridoxamine kinase [Oscillospiraceae bacterium]
MITTNAEGAISRPNQTDPIPPRVAAIHDLSGAGKCSLTVALPVLSAMGCEVCAMPTALLSTHTGGIPGFTYRDLTDDLPRFAEHWAALGLTFDAIYTGFAASSEQLTAIGGALETLRGSKTLVLVDPVMGDQGALYKTYTPAMVGATRTLCAQADIITPNLTEAALLLGIPYGAIPREREPLRGILDALLKLGPTYAIITGITFSDGSIGALGSDGTWIAHPAVPGVWHGTGDLFASILLGAIMSGAPFSEAAALADDATRSAIQRTYRNGTDPRFGVHFEAELGRLCQFAEKQRGKLG